MWAKRAALLISVAAGDAAVDKQEPAAPMNKTVSLRFSPFIQLILDNNASQTKKKNFECVKEKDEI
jgi:hypothetical protein